MLCGQPFWQDTGLDVVRGSIPARPSLAAQRRDGRSPRCHELIEDRPHGLDHDAEVTALVEQCGIAVGT